MLSKDTLEDMLEDAVHASRGDLVDLIQSHLEAYEQISLLNARIITLPNAVTQSTPTNCMAGCVATLLEVPIDSVPGCDAERDWDPRKFQEWLAKRGLQYLEIRLCGPVEFAAFERPMPCIVVGQSPRGGTGRLHATVGTFWPGGKIIYDHDPFPAGKFCFGSPIYLGFFVPLGRGTVFPPETEFIIRRQRGKRATYIQVAKFADDGDPYDWWTWYEVGTPVKATRFHSAAKAAILTALLAERYPHWKISIEAVLKRKESHGRPSDRRTATTAKPA